LARFLQLPVVDVIGAIGRGVPIHEIDRALFEETGATYGQEGPYETYTEPGPYETYAGEGGGISGEIFPQEVGLYETYAQEGWRAATSSPTSPPPHGPKC
jgi:hypothetical protein